MPETQSDARNETHLRLVWPQWQGAGSDSVEQFREGIDFDVIRRGYAAGAKVLQAVLPEHDGPEVVIPVEMGARGLETRDGIEAKQVVLEQLQAALDVIAEQDPDRITTLGGECSVSMAPFAALAKKYGEDFAILWIDSHPDMGVGESEYDGYHAMVVSALTGHGDAELLAKLPATVPTSRVALVGMHDWTDETLPAVADDWGLSVFGPETLRADSSALLAWLRATGATKVAVHFDVDTVDAAEARLGLGADFGGLSIAETRRVVADIEKEVDVVALTIAEFIPRQVLQLQQVVDGFPLIGTAN